MNPRRPPNYLFNCELQADNDRHFKVSNDKNKHELSFKMVSLGGDTSGELQTVEAEARN